jgi:hypothetical protein
LISWRPTSPGLRRFESPASGARVGARNPGIVAPTLLETTMPIEEAIGPILTVLFIAALLADRFFLPTTPCPHAARGAARAPCFSSSPPSSTSARRWLCP